MKLILNWDFQKNKELKIWSWDDTGGELKTEEIAYVKTQRKQPIYTLRNERRPE